MVIPPSKRVQGFVSRRIQGGLLWQFATSWLVYNLLLWHGMFLLDAFVFQSRVSGVSSQSVWELYTGFCRQNMHLAICALVIAPWFFWNGLWMTHRVAGPLERFREALNRLERGEPVKPLTLRRDDLLIEYQHAFNRYLASLERDEKSRSARQKENEACSDATKNPWANGADPEGD